MCKTLGLIALNPLILSFSAIHPFRAEVCSKRSPISLSLSLKAVSNLLFVFAV